MGWRLRRFFRRRTFFLFSVCLLLVLLPVLFFLGLGMRQIGAADVAAYRLLPGTAGRPVLGGGLNLLSFGESNLLDLGGFEPLSYRKALRVSDGDEQRILVVGGEQEEDPLSALPLDEFFNGASAQILRRRGGGQQLVKETRVISCQPEHLSSFLTFHLPPDTPENLPWSAFAGQGSRCAAISRNGYFLLGLGETTPRLRRIPGGASLLDLAFCDRNCLILDGLGRIWQIRPDGELRQLKKSPGLNLSCLASRVTEEGDELLAAGSQGRVLRGPLGSLREETVPMGGRLIAAAAGDRGFYLLNDHGELFLSASAGKWESLGAFGRNAGYAALTVSGKDLLLCGSRGRVLLSHNGGAAFRAIEPEALSAALPPGQALPDLRDGAFLSSSRIWLRDASGRLLESLDDGASWSILPEKNPVEAMLVPDRNRVLLAEQGRGLIYAEIGAELLLEEALEEGSYRAGDLLRLEKLAALPTSRSENPINFRLPAARLGKGDNLPRYQDWFLSANLKAEISESEAAPDGGRSCLHLRRDSTRAFDDGGEAFGLYSGERLLLDESSQDLRLLCYPSASARNVMLGQRAFDLEFWARSVLDGGEINLSLEGLDPGPETQRRMLSQEWRQYSVSFILPAPLSENDHPRLLFRLGAKEDILLDRVRLSLSADEYPFSAELRLAWEQKPPVLRFDSLRLGARELASEFWLSRSGETRLVEEDAARLAFAGSLSAAGRLAEAASASPWLVIRPWISELELRHLMQYMFGSNSSEYGALRLQEGNASRWSDLYSRIYLEFTEGESEDLFGSDAARQAFVNWAGEIIASTPEYRQFQQQLVLVDGMSYKDGILLSGADSHASDFGQLTRIENWGSLAAASDSRAEQAPRDPEMGGMPRPEFLRSVEAGGPELRFCDLMGTFLQAIQKESPLCLLNAGQGMDDSLALQLNAALALSRELGGSRALGIQEERSGNGNDKEAPPAFAFETKDSFWFIVTNTGDAAILAQLSGRELSGAHLQSFDGSGKLLEERELNRRISAFSVLPGGMTVLRMEKQP